MPPNLTSLTITPAEDAIAELKREWAWLLPADYVPVLFSALGDLFYVVPSGEIWWLNMGTADMEKVAESKAVFEHLLETETASNWFLPPLIERLVQAGKVLKEGQCYSFVTPPIFKEGTYTVGNLNPVDAREHFGWMGILHRQICDLPDGSKVHIKVK
jgi:Domain of unknown function (DUF1851)